MFAPEEYALHNAHAVAHVARTTESEEMLRRVFQILIALGALAATDAAAATLTVCASGCQYSSPQAAIDAAQPGDTITLRANETFSSASSFVLKAKSCAANNDTCYITITSDAAAANLPPAGQRITPAYSQYLPKLRVTTNNVQTIRTALPPAVASYYKLQFLEIIEDRGWNDAVRLGTTDSAQNSTALIPHHFVIDRCIVRGHPQKGAKNGISMQANHVTVQDSYIFDIKMKRGTQSNGLSSANGAGPFTIVNNYIEASGLNVIFGGADPWVPNLVPSNITFRFNHVAKNVAWMGPIAPAPTGVQATAATGGGTLAAGTYYYKVSARVECDSGGVSDPPYTDVCTSPASQEASATLSATGRITVSWNAVPNAVKYRVYGRAAGAQNAFWSIDAPTTQYVDNGTAGTAGTPPAFGDYWGSKNLFEIKSAQDVQVDSNIFENNWSGTYDQNGYAVLLRSEDQSGGTACTWCVAQRIVFEKNIVRHSTAALSLIEVDGANAIPMNDVTIRNNLFDDINRTTWHVANACPAGSCAGASNYYVSISGGDQMTIDHNTFIGPGHPNYVGFNNPTADGFVFNNNMGPRGSFGVKGAGTTEGVTTLSTFAPGYSFLANVVAGASGGTYPAGTHRPTHAAWQGDFVNYNSGSGGNYRLNGGSAYNNAGTDSKDLGADIDLVESATANVISGGCGGCEFTHLTDDFNDNTLANTWSTTVFGFNDPNTPVNETNMQLEIGPLPLTAGAHWRGIQSANAYNFSDSYAHMKLVQAPPAAETLVFAIFGVHQAQNNYYRWVVNGGTLTCQRRLGTDVPRETLCTLNLAGLGHEWLRIRHEGGLVKFQTADDTGGVPAESAWETQYSETWNTAAVPLTNIRFDIKAGADSPPSSSVLVVWDDFRSARP